MKKLFLFLSLIFLISLVSSVPTEFDWRNYNGQNWVTPVKDQASCGACWAFASVGITEAIYNIERNDSNFDLDLSEQHLVSNYSSAGDCSGGSSGAGTIRDKGIVAEECFKYESQNSNMDNICGGAGGEEWTKRLWKINGGGAVKWSNKSAIKQALIEHGPLDYNIRMSGEFINGVYSNCNLSINNHAVVLVGYNDTGGYWVAKNSWGESWNGNGYFKLDYNTCGPTNNLVYLTLDKNQTYATNANSILPSGNVSDIEKKDDKKLTLSGESSAEILFNLLEQSGAEKMYLLINQAKVGNVSMNLNYFGESYDFTVQNNEGIARFNLCGNSTECSQITNGNLNVTYRGELFSNLFLDWLSLEGVYTGCRVNIVEEYSEWENEGECLINDTLVQSRNVLRYDSNNCGTFENQTFIEERTINCDYCVPNLVNSSWSEWEDNFCSGDNLNQSRYSVEYDQNACYQITGLESDYWENITHYEFQLINPIFQTTPWSDWENEGECIDELQLQIRTATQYDLNNCAENQTIQEERNILCGDFSIEINPGWNLLSIPYSQGISPRELKELSGGAIDDNPIWLYSNNGYFRVSNIDEKILPGVGFWAFSFRESEIKIPADFMFSNKDLVKGWNLVGSSSVEQSLEEIIGNCSVVGGAWYWNNTEEKYYLEEDKIIPGKGIWFYALGNCTLHGMSSRGEGEIVQMEISPPNPR